MGVLFAGVVNDLQLGEHHKPNRVAFFVKDFLKKDFPKKECEHSLNDHLKRVARIFGDMASHPMASSAKIKTLKRGGAYSAPTSSSFWEITGAMR